MSCCCWAELLSTTHISYSRRWCLVLVGPHWKRIIMILIEVVYQWLWLRVDAGWGLGLPHLAIISPDCGSHYSSLAAEMIQLWQTLGLGLVLSVGTSASSSTRQFLPLFDRDPRSLRDTFPFSAQSNDISPTDIREDRQVKTQWSSPQFKLN